MQYIDGRICNIIGPRFKQFFLASISVQNAYGTQTVYFCSDNIMFSIASLNGLLKLSAIAPIFIKLSTVKIFISGKRSPQSVAPLTVYL